MVAPAVDPRPLVFAYLASLVGESVLFGLLVLLFSQTIYLIVRRPSKTAKGRPSAVRYLVSIPFLSAVTLCILALVHWILTFSRAFFAFTQLQNTDTERAFFADLARPDSVAKNALYLVGLTLADAIVVHRLWIVWNKRCLVALLPILATLGGGVLCAMTILELTHCKIDDPNGCKHGISHWGMPWYALTIFTNFYSTGLIIRRIQAVSSSAPDSTVSSPGGSTSLMKFLSILVESAALQTTWVSLTFIVIAANSDAEFFFVDTFLAVASISAVLLHARVALGWACQPEREGASAGGEKESV
ncbi:Aminotran-5 domain-containing protein [Mycena kentingensis (nom. inval.)]|nr:Aminotran-5 domain-containing protein [Mycena kentingensis (nom. inval.)]